MAWANKRPPTKSGRYLVTYLGTVRQADRFLATNCNQWTWSILPNSGWASDKEVTAWQKEPKPYHSKESE